MMKKGLVILATIIGVIALGNVLIAGAQAATPPVTSSATGTQSFGPNGVYTNTVPFGGGQMFRGGAGSMFNDGQLHDQIQAALAQKLGMTVDELTSARQSGQTITDLANARGIALADLRQVILDVHQAALDALVKQGQLTQAQADQMLARMQAMPGFGSDGFGPGDCLGLQQNRNGAQPNDFRGGPGGMMGGRGMRWSQPSGQQG
jgi:hypothetical protein